MSNKCPSRGVRYVNDEDKIKGRKNANNKYSSLYWTCDVCNAKMRNGNKSRHMKTLTHQKNLKKLKDHKCPTCSESEYSDQEH